MKIKKVVIIGAGQMGSGIAHVCALAGFDVGVNDVSKDRIDAGLTAISGNLGRQLKSGKITDADRNAALKRITPVANYEGFADYDLVVEGGSEGAQDTG